MNPTPRYSATIKGHTISLGDGQYYYAESHTFDTMASNVVSGTVRDSRDYYTTTTKEVEMIDYIKLHIDKISIERTEQLSSEALLNANGVWFNGDFSEGTSNTLAASFQYKLSGDTEWIDGGTLTPTIEGNTFKFTDISLGNIYDYNNEYQFKIILSDLLMIVGSEDKEAITLPKGQEVVAIGDDAVWVYGDLLLNDKPVGVAVYSTEEVVVGIWKDGKPVYRKVISSIGKTGTDVNIAHNISNLKKVVRSDIVSSNNNGTSYPDNNGIFSLCVKKIDITNIVADVGSEFNNWYVDIVLEYTKTTD
jgi:hypothetical protein